MLCVRACVRACVCVWISGMCLRKVTGSDRHVKNPLGLWRLSVPHTHCVFLACYPPCTHKDTLTLSWIICHADLLSSFVTCSDLLCSPVLTTEAILLLGHHFAQTSGPFLHYFCLSSSLSLLSPSYHILIYVSGSDKWRVMAVHYACIPPNLDSALNYSGYEKCFRNDICFKGAKRLEL